MSGILRPRDISAEGVLQAMQIAGDELRLGTATTDQLTAAAGFLARSLARFPDSLPRDARKFEAITRLETAGKATGAEIRRRSRPNLAH